MPDDAGDVGHMTIRSSSTFGASAALHDMAAHTAQASGSSVCPSAQVIYCPASPRGKYAHANVPLCLTFQQPCCSGAREAARWSTAQQLVRAHTHTP
jgi:hypothetical protein